MQKTGDIILRYAYQKEMMKSRLLDDAEIERIAERVMQRPSHPTPAQTAEWLRPLF